MVSRRWVGRLIPLNLAGRTCSGVQLACHVRSQSTALHFYQNRQLELYASKEAHRLTLRQLVFFGRSMDEDRLLKSANYVRTEIPVRIAHRIRDLQTLPYIVVTQEGVAKVYELYWSAFEKFRLYPPINNMNDNRAFCQFLENVLAEHAPVIPSLSLGLSLSSPHLPPDSLDSFMRRMLISRISRRVLAEHHIALSKSIEANTNGSEAEPRVGIIYTGLNIKRSIHRCTNLLRERPYDTEDDNGETICNRAWPEVVVDGHVDTTFAYIREHVEYIIFELLKNAMRATVLNHRYDSELPSIHATIVVGVNDVGIRISDQGGGLSKTQISAPSDLFSFSHVRNATRMDHNRIGALRSASSRGIKATVAEQVGDWHDLVSNESLISPSNHEDPEREAGIASHPRIGLGLPMSNIFTTYFGGSLELVSLDGWGTDVYLRLPKLGTNLEGIEL